MHIISRKKLLVAGEKWPDSTAPLDAWYRIAKGADWKSLTDVKQTYPHADGVKVGAAVYTVFNIGGNKYRMITEIFYKDRTILVRHILTHKEYDQGGWKCQ